MTKTHTGNVKAFKSGDFGFLGEVVVSRDPLRRQHIAIGTADMPCMEIRAMLGGADGELMRYAAMAALGMNVPTLEAAKYAVWLSAAGQLSRRMR